MSHEKPDKEHMRKELDAAASMINAIETGATDEFDRGAVRTMRALLALNEHLVEENTHIKKGMDLLLEQIFRAQNSGS